MLQHRVWVIQTPNFCISLFLSWRFHAIVLDSFIYYVCTMPITTSCWVVAFMHFHNVNVRENHLACQTAFGCLPTKPSLQNVQKSQSIQVSGTPGHVLQKFPFSLPLFPSPSGVLRQISPLTLQVQKWSKEGSKCSFLGMVGGGGGAKKERSSIYQWPASSLPGNQDLQNSHFSNIRQKTVPALS